MFEKVEAKHKEPDKYLDDEERQYEDAAIVKNMRHTFKLSVGFDYGQIKQQLRQDQENVKYN